jgi:hypothetical protein
MKLSFVGAAGALQGDKVVNFSFEHVLRSDEMETGRSFTLNASLLAADFVALFFLDMRL